MKKETLKSLMSVYLNLRKLWDPIIKPNDLSIYRTDAETFSKKINSMEYKMDKLGGLIDRTDDPNTFFDRNKVDNRDCDDFARQWSIWGVVNNCTSKEWVICNPSNVIQALSTMHVITTLEQDGRFWLCNYEIYGPFNTEKEALDFMESFPSYESDRLVDFYREFRL